MALRLTKTSKIIFAISIVILSGALGFLIWRVNQEESTGPEDSEAGSSNNGACWDCCTASEFEYDENGNKYCPGGSLCACTVKCGDGVTINKQCNMGDSEACTNCYHAAPGDDDPVGGVECNIGSQCNKTCYWPEVNYCNSNGTCTCKSTSNNCGDSEPSCQPKCPSGYTECSGSSCGSNTKTATCSAVCSGCDNKYTYKITCDKDSTPIASSCGDGKVDTGEDCDPNASPTGCNTGSTCLNDCSCSAVTEDTCGDGTLDTGEECEVGDPTGNSCTWVNCNQSTCLCKALSITKGVIESCIDEGTENPKAQLTYTVTVANSGTEDRTVTKIEDVLDSKILTNSIIPTNITSPGTYSNGKILWDYQTTNLIVKGGETKVYTYKVQIDKENFGEYTNTVTLTRSTGVTSEASSKIIADCVIEVPQTGIFDSTLGRIGIGLALLVIGGIVYTIPNRMLIVHKKENTYKYREGFEKKVSNR